MSSSGPHPELRSAPAHVFVADLDAPELDEDDSHHLTRVLRLRPGEAVGLSDGAGAWRLGRLTPSGVEAEGPISVDPAPQPALGLAIALPKGDRGDWAVQKVTELGVDEIIVLDSARSVVRWDGDRASRGTARLRRIIRQAAMQARLTRLPSLAGPLTVAQLLQPPASAGEAASGVVPPSAAGGAAGWAPGWAAAEPGAPHGPGLAQPRILIGPEGGWADGELPAGLVRVGLGPTVLRTETAAVAAATVLGLARAGLLS